MSVRRPGLRLDNSLDGSLVSRPAASRAGSIATRKEQRMSTTVCSYTSTALCNEQERGVPHDAPLPLPLIEYAADEPQARSCIFEVVSQLTRLAAQRLPVTAASPLCRTSQASKERPFADQVCTTVSACLQQGFRRLL